LQIAPKVAFAPLFIMWLGYNAWPKLIVTVLVVFFPILVNVLQSMKTVDRDLINLARAYSMNRLQIFWKIEVPASMPALMAGLRNSQGGRHMEHKPIYPEIKPDNVVIPKGENLSTWLSSRIARYDTRQLDWDALKFQADYDPKYRRAQMRYVGTGGTGVEGDDN